MPLRGFFSQRRCTKVSRAPQDFVLRTTSVSPLDRDKGTLPLTREKCFRIFPYFSFQSSIRL